MSITHTYTEPYDIAKKQIELLEKNGMKFSGNRVLDLGCGTGMYDRIIKESGAGYVVGIDKYFINTKEARKINKNTQNYFICGDITQIPLKKNFDIIIARGSLYYIPERLNNMILKISEFLATGGEIFITFTNSSLKSRILNFIKILSAKLPDIMKPFIKIIIAVLFYTLSYLLTRQKPRWWVVLEKTNTIFFPIKHFTSKEDAEELLKRNNFTITKYYEEFGISAPFNSDFGIIARKNG